MDKLSALTRGKQLMLAASALLIIDSFFAWQKYDGPGSEIAAALGVKFSRNAWHGFLGIVMVLAAIVLLVWLVARVVGVELPMPVSETVLGAGLAALIVLFAVIKNLDDDYSTFWSYLGVLFAIGVAAGAWLEVQAAGGMDTLKSELPSRESFTSSSSTAATTPAPPPPAAPSEPPAAPPPPSDPPPASSEPTS